MSAAPEIDIDAIHRQAHELEIRKAALEAELLTLRSTRTLKSTPSDSALPKDAPVISSSTSSAHSLESAYRMEGLTLFSAVDPSPGHRKLLGIRIDSFSRKTRTFLKPHYILLALTPNSKAPGNEYFQVVKHTLPATVDIRIPTKKFLPSTAVRYQDLESFARWVRRRVDGIRERKEGIEELRNLFGAGMVRVDDKGEVVEMEFEEGGSGRLVLNEEGEVVRAVIRDADQDGVVGERRPDIEPKMLGPFSTLAQRMGWA